MQKKRGRFTQWENRQLFQDIEAISISIYNYFCLNSCFISCNCFPYFCILKQESYYHFHYLIYKKRLSLDEEVYFNHEVIYLCSQNFEYFRLVYQKKDKKPKLIFFCRKRGNIVFACRPCVKHLKQLGVQRKSFDTFLKSVRIFFVPYYLWWCFLKRKIKRGLIFCSVAKSWFGTEKIQIP